MTEQAEHEPTFHVSGQNDIAHNMRLVLDTDVVLSGLRSTVGASRILLLAVEAGVVTPLVSVAMVIEYEAVLKREEHLTASRLDANEVDTFLDAFVAHAERWSTFSYRPRSVILTMRYSSELRSMGTPMRS